MQRQGLFALRFSILLVAVVVNPLTFKENLMKKFVIAQHVTPETITGIVLQLRRNGYSAWTETDGLPVVVTSASRMVFILCAGTSSVLDSNTRID